MDATTLKEERSARGATQVSTIGVVGAGTMGNGIAHAFAQSGYMVWLIDVGEEVLTRAMSTIGKNLDRMVKSEKITPAVREAFARYSWPGNVRELENACERMIQTCSCGTLRVGCLAASVLFGAAKTALPGGAVPSADPQPISLDDRLLQVESNLIGWALKVAEGNKSRAAALLNIKRSTLGDRIARCGLTEPEEARA